VRARQVARPDRPRPFRGLEIPQDFEGLGEFFQAVWPWSVSFQGSCFPLSDSVAPYLYYYAYVSYPIVLYKFYLIMSRLGTVRLGSPDQFRPRLQKTS